jgi:hypothetical protein
MFCAGDLIRIPSSVYLYKMAEIPNMVPAFKVTDKPELALFIEYLEPGNCVINKHGERWRVRTDVLRIYEDKNDKTNRDNKITR